MGSSCPWLASTLLQGPMPRPYGWPRQASQPHHRPFRLRGGCCDPPALQPDFSDRAPILPGPITCQCFPAAFDQVASLTWPPCQSWMWSEPCPTVKAFPAHLVLVFPWRDIHESSMRLWMGATALQNFALRCSSTRRRIHSTAPTWRFGLVRWRCGLMGGFPLPPPAPPPPPLPMVPTLERTASRWFCAVVFRGLEERCARRGGRLVRPPFQTSRGTGGGCGWRSSVFHEQAGQTSAQSTVGLRWRRGGPVWRN